MAGALTNEELLARLVAFDSTSSVSNLPMAEFIAEYVSDPDVEIFRCPSADGEKMNLVAIRDAHTGSDRNGLILSGHMDAVPARENGWESDPFTLTVKGDQLVGRGSSDMKAFLAIAMNELRHAGRKLKAPLVLLFTYDEEVGTLGARHFTETWNDRAPLPRHCIIGEPTSLRAIRMHKGHLKLKVTAAGRSAHSGYPHLGDNAIEKGARAVCALAALRDELESERSPESQYFADVPFAPMNVGTIRGGVAVNIVPDRCEIEIGIRPLPGMECEALIERVRKAVSAKDVTVETISNSPAMLLDRESPIHRLLCELVGQTRFDESVAFATDAGWLQTLGIECVLFGPGSIEVAHRPNEFVPRKEIALGAEQVRRVVERLCVEGK